MRRFTMMMGIVALAAIFAGCQGDDQSSSQAQLEEKRQELISSMEGTLEDIGDKLDRMGEKIADASSSGSEEMQQELQKQYDDLSDEQAKLEQQLDRARNASADEWQKMSSDVERSLKDLSSRVNRAWDDLTHD